MIRERVVIGYDGSASAERALRFAVRLPDAPERVVVVITAWCVDGTGPAAVAAERARLVELQRSAIVAALRGVPPAARPVVTSEIIVADPVSALTDAARVADLVVIGEGGGRTSRDRSLPQRLSQRLRERPRHYDGPCPLVVVTAATDVPVDSVLIPAVA
jgi:hypothetical protein